MFCENDGRPAVFQCAACSRALCERCVRRIGAGRYSVPVCPVCGGHVEPVEAGPRNLSRQSFWYYLVTALYYPLTGKGPIVLLLNWLFVGVALALSVLAMVSVPFLGILGLVVAYGYVYFLLFTAIQKNSLGEDESPSTPEFDNLIEVVPALLKVIALFAVWTAPALLASYGADGQPANLFSFESAGLLLGGPGTLLSYVMGRGHTDIVRVVAGFGLLILPMSLLAVATFNSLRGLHPVPIILTILRVPLQYLFCCAAFYGVLVLRDVLVATVMIEANLLLGLLAMPLFLVYSLYVLGRVLGGLHAANSARFGWVRT
jgi:hypothetical protein